MLPRRLSLILTALALPGLSACELSNPMPAEATIQGSAAQDAPGSAPDIAPASALSRAVDALFASEDTGDTRALLVLRNGKAIAERYGEGFGPDTRQLGWSLSKCVTGVMIGMLVSDGRLRLDETAPVPAWQRTGDPRGAITLRMLLQMRSGLSHVEEAARDYTADTTRMLFLDGRDNMAAYAEAQPLAAMPGRRFNYSSGDTLILADLAARALTDSPEPEARRAATLDYLRSRLFEPARMPSMIAEFDAAGTLIGSSMIWGTAHDWAQLGEFLRKQGKVDGAQLVPRGWIAFMLRPSPRNPAFGAQLWLNRAKPDEPDLLFRGKRPAELFACLGEHGQYVIVSPSQRLTLVRLGESRGEELPALRARLLDVLIAAPKN